MAQNRSLPSNTKNFGATPPIKASRSTFNLSRNWKGTFDAGRLIPLDVFEVIPGDTHKVRLSAIARLATPLKPVMDNLMLDFHCWWAPMRQLWENTEKFFGEQENPGDSIDYLVPQVVIGPTDTPSNELANYFGLPTKNLTASANVNSLPFRMYHRVWNFHYRDQNLQSSLSQPTNDGPDSGGIYGVQKRGKRHDYFTASLPQQQKGNPVGLALGGVANVETDAAQGSPVSVDILGGAPRYLDAAGANATVSAAGITGGELYVDLGNASNATITQLRQSIALQHVLERDARSGTRYPEILMSRYRVLDPQMLVLQRPEYLGGGTKAVTISPIAQTAQSDKTDPAEETPQGNLAAVGTSMVDGIGFTRSFTEHGYVMIIVSARADLTYQQGIERMWNKRERFDFYHPELAHLSEQAVLSKELYADGTAADDDVWGYIGAYDEYRYGRSKVTSLFNSKAPQSLDVWHLSQEFANRPTLNNTFIEENPPIDRVIAVQDEPHFIMDCFINHIAARPMPLSGIPGLSRI